ncbi:MAG: Clp1/GlmU family protein, partial [Candidatus Caldatribacteriota bacterium]
DSGKTSFIKILAQYLVRRNRKVGIIDLDIGQSTLGPPGTISMGVLDKERLKKKIIPVCYMIFIGSTSPGKCVDRFLARVYYLYCLCQREKVDVLLVDTTGLVTGSVGVYLKCNLIEKINPTIIVALQFGQELEPILEIFKSQSSRQIFRIKPFPNISEKNWIERKKRREKQFKIYFRDSLITDIDFTTLPITGIYFDSIFLSDTEIITQLKEKYQLEVISGDIIDSKMILILPGPPTILSQDIVTDIKKCYKLKQIILLFPDWFSYLLVSFNNKEGFSNGLGIIKEIDFKQKKMTVYLPASISLENLAQIEIGQLKVKPDGSELPYIEPAEY